MTSLTTTLRQTKPSTIAGVVGFAAILAAAAQVTLPIPGTPVPFSLQPLVVVLAGLMLGPVAGAASMGLYLVAGALGAPVFSPVPGLPQGVARFFGPTGGYLIAYPVAAWVAGSLAGRQSTFFRRFLAACGGIAMIFVGGIAQLTIITGSIGRALDLGITPFVPLDAVKALMAAGIATPRKQK
ncbi:MAG TPA: biotin transporter BioY [Gemmatimonadaceae bacterium]|nr:biotin transporter BioY [Gemmatimonadaceae bacterium]